MNSKAPALWTVADVGEWLQCIDLSQYRRNFESLKIDGSLLFEITDSDLDMDLSIKIRLHRVKLLEAIKKLKHYVPPPVVQAAARLDLEEAKSDSDSEDQAQVHAIRLPDQHEDSSLDASSTEVLVLKAVEGLLLNNIYIVGQAGATLGRHTASNDIVVSESFVSRRHCDVKYIAPGSFVLQDVGSTTGTFLMLQRPTLIVLNLMFQMGLSEFKAKSVRAGANPILELEVFEGPAKHTTVKVDPEGVTIGRDPENQFNVREDSQMSSRHGRIYLQDGAFLLEDLGSTNKTWVRLSEEGARSRETPLAVGDVVKVGTTVLTVLPPDMSHFQSPVRAAVSEEPVDLTKSIAEEVACKICFARESNCALYPCGHVFCDHCIANAHTCPVCRKPVRDRVKLFRQ